MKDPRIVYIKGEPRVVEWPKDSAYYCLSFSLYGCYTTECKCADQWVSYELACESAIANGVPPADKEQVRSIVAKEDLSKGLYILKEGHPYSLEGYEVKVEKQESKTKRECLCEVADHFPLKDVTCECNGILGPSLPFRELVAVITPKEK